jgi:arylsulfatase A-like enzyme
MNMSYKMGLIIGVLLIIIILFYYNPTIPQHPARIHCVDCNVIVISLDALRADHVGVYGYERNTTPNIDAIAGDGITFTNAFSNSPNTLSSHMSIFTSTYPNTHGVMFSRVGQSLPESILTLPEILKIYGYKTIWFASLLDYNLNLSEGFGRGIEEAYDNTVPHLSRDDFLELIENNSEDRFFIFYHTSDIHDPYVTPEPLNSKFDPDYNGSITGSYSEFFEGERVEMKEFYENNATDFFDRMHATEDDEKQAILDYLYNTSIETRKKYIEFVVEKQIIPQEQLDMETPRQRFWEPVERNSPYDMEHVTALYDSGIFFTDSFMGEIRDTLEEAGILNKTILIITADHGEEFMEHGGILHEQLYEECTHVPLIFMIPEVPGGFRENLVQSIDILPTVLDILGIPVPTIAEGTSLVPSINNPGTETNEFIFSLWTGVSSIRTKEWKYIIYDSGKKELYNLLTDPDEKDNLFSGNPGIADTLEEELMSWRGSRPLISETNEFFSRIDPELRKELIRTGYW